MEKYSNKLMMLTIVCLLFIGGVSHTKVRTVTGRRDLERSIAKESKVVVLFYDDRDKDLARMYEDVSAIQRYDDADVIFLKVNAARKELRDLAQLYGVTAMPAFIFFSKGKRLVNNKVAPGVVMGAPAMLTGSVSRDRLQSFIDEYYGVEIEQYIAKKDARNKQRLVQEKESWKPYFYPRDIFVRSYGPEERDLE